MGWTSRSAVVSLKLLAIAVAVAVAFLAISLIVGATGPKVFSGSQFSAFACADGSHFAFDPQHCSGYQPLSGQFSPQYVVHLVPLNRRLLVTVTPFVADNATVLLEDMLISTLVSHRNSNAEPWTLFANRTLPYSELCVGTGIQCPALVVFDDSTLDKRQYAVSVAIHSQKGVIENLAGLEDVLFTLWSDSAAFSKMVLLVRLVLLSVSVAGLIYHLLLLRSESERGHPWRLDQQLLVILLFALCFFNNPFYPIQFVLPGVFFEFMGILVETLFTCVLFYFWFALSQKLRTGAETTQYTNQFYFKLALIGLYLIFQLAVGLYISCLASASPYFGLWDPTVQNTSAATAEQNSINTVVYLFWTKTIFFFALVAATFHTFYLHFVSWREKPYLQYQLRVFVLPAFLVLVSWVTETFVDNDITFYGRHTPAVLYMLVLGNVYVYFSVWSLWPVEVSLGAGRPAALENDKLFTEAKEAPDAGRYGSNAAD